MEGIFYVICVCVCGGGVVVCVCVCVFVCVCVKETLDFLPSLNLRSYDGKAATDGEYIRQHGA